MDDVELLILGTEPLVVEFANTLYGEEDFLGPAWFAAVGMAPVRDIGAARSLRDGIRTLFTGDGPPAAAIAVVNAAAAQAPTYPQLVGAATAERRSAATGDAALLGGLASAGIELLTDGRARPLRRCEAPDCCLFFVQHHARRRYCHESCAHRDRQARYARRRRSA